VQAAGEIVNVHRLRSQTDCGSGGGILDNDDRLCDVAADKEQVQAQCK